MDPGCPAGSFVGRWRDAGAGRSGLQLQGIRGGIAEGGAQGFGALFGQWGMCVSLSDRCAVRLARSRILATSQRQPVHKMTVMHS